VGSPRPRPRRASDRVGSSLTTTLESILSVPDARSTGRGRARSDEKPCRFCVERTVSKNSGSGNLGGERGI
jgi:hypothetical protein